MKVLKNIARVTLLSAGLFSFTAAQSFEGMIEMQMKDQNQESSMPVKYLVKGDLIRMEMQSPRGEMTMIMDSKNKKTIILMPQMQSYMERSMDVPAQPAGDAKKSEITKTGKTEKILGYDCEQFIMKGEKGQTEMWAAKGLGTFMRPGMGGPGGRMGGPGGMEATKIEKKELDAALFKVPEGWQKMDMQMMGRPRN
ncbi:MAG: hypothetical protein HW374_2168 [Bacteroidetes bacterium]|nr:hypothetical protein [Bacteroidota bacterium]